VSMELLRKPVTIVWAALMMATIASTWLLSNNSVTPEVATVAIMLIAAIKVRLVMSHFMEVRRAPLALRLVCDGWLLAVTALILTVYLL
jgi:heme/copper-type cytochrome/quinol oxidase subunit 4